MKHINVTSKGRAWSSEHNRGRAFEVDITFVWDPEYPIEVSMLVAGVNDAIWHMPADILSRFLSDPSGRLMSWSPQADWAAGVQKGQAIFSFHPDCPPTYVTCPAVDALGFIAAVMVTITENWTQVHDTIGTALDTELEKMLNGQPE